MPSNRLQTFVTVVEKGSFTEAAEAMYSSQSSVSQQIRNLEKTLGVNLFDHAFRHVTLTPAGQAFYPRACQLLQEYAEAVTEARISEVRSQHFTLRCGCVYDQITQFWLDIYHLSDDLQSRYQPVASRYENRLELYQALLHGNVDISLQMENDAIAELGLEFMPLAACPDLCVFLYPSELLLKDDLVLEDLDDYRVALHYPEGYVLYEDRLREALKARRSQPTILNPSDFRRYQYGLPIVLMVPGFRYPIEKKQYARPLRWGEGIRMGFVFSRDGRKEIREYAEAVRDIIQRQGCPWKTAYQAD